MMFLLDMNLPRELGKKLTVTGHECRHVGDIGMAEASDIEIVEKARKYQETILTHDLDYGHLLAFSGEAVPSVIIFRLHNTHVNNLFYRVIDVWSEIEKPLKDGAIVLIEDATVRIRELPITRG
ncbi:MAG: DUF5615 family PIN-like protein [Deltaproteobacteria bacterium]|nr:DUF5615 family PIN-like protein [Deltaproteobacteria bacterium]